MAVCAHALHTLHALLPDTDEAAGVGEIWRGVWARSVTPSWGDEDRSSRVWRRRWRGVPRPPQQDGQDEQDEEAAVAEAQSMRGHPHWHGARRVAEELPVVRHWRTVWGELGQNYSGFLASVREDVSLLIWHPFCCVLQLCLNILTKFRWHKYFLKSLLPKYHAWK